jgi:formylmethanofuran dehydrogenase subunit C
VWHVDYLKILHKDPHVITTILNLVDGKYGQEIVGGERAALTINRGKIHNYLGMTLDYSVAGSVKINMTDYVDKVLEEAPDSMDGTATTPADKNLFEVRDNITSLNEDDAEFFHAMVA